LTQTNGGDYIGRTTQRQSETRKWRRREIHQRPSRIISG